MSTRRGLDALTYAGARMADSAKHSSDGPPPHISKRQILEIALKMAAQGGDDHPTLIQYSEGDRARANLVAANAVVLARQSTCLIAIRGQFIYTAARRPRGAPAPRGTVMTLVVDATTGKLLDLGISDRYPRLEELGPVMTALP